MKSILVFFPLLLFASYSAKAEGAELKVGMDLATLTERLNAKDIEVGMEYQLSIMPPDQKTELQFSNLDDDITLVIAYDKVTEKVTGLDLHFIPDNRTSKSQVVVRSASLIKILNNGELVFHVLPERRKKTAMTDD